MVYTTWNDQGLGSVRISATRNPNADNQWKVTSKPGHYTHPTFSPDGNTVVFAKTGGGHLTSPLWSRDQGIYKVSARGGETKRIRKSGRRPQFANESDRLYLLQGKWEKEADNLALISVNLEGEEEQTHYTSQWATDYQLSPDGKWVAFVERFNVYLAPFVKASKAVSVGPKAKTLPIRRVSEEAGANIQFSGDSQTLHWSLGPTLYSRPLKHSFTFIEGAPETLPEDPVTEMKLGFSAPHAAPEGSVAFVGGNILTMAEAGLIQDGVILFERNRIKAVGSRDDVTIPPGTKIINLENQLVMPGFIDMHAHGSQASQGLTPQQNWVDYARLAFGVTTIHDPSNDTESIFAASEMTKAGAIIAPRTYSTGTILYGATGSAKAEVASLEDALFHLKRMQAVGAFTVKSYNQPRRDQRQQVLAAARQLGMMVVPEGGSTFMHNLTMIADGHTGIEHTFPVEAIYDDVLDFWRNTGVGYTPTLSVAYGGLTGENYWYEKDDLWRHPRLTSFIPPHRLEPRARRRLKAPDEDYNHQVVARITKQTYDQGGLVQAGGHGQLNGIDTHWEIWSFVQGGMTPAEALECGTLHGARYLGLDKDLGSLEPGKLADVVVIQPGFDPLKNIRHSEFIQYVVANGRVFEAATMKQVAPQTQDPHPFFWTGDNAGLAKDVPPPPESMCHACPAGHH